MAEEKEIFNPGHDVAGNGAAPEIVSSGKSLASPVDSFSVLTVQKDDDTLQYIKTRPQESDFSGEEGTPVLAFRKASNDGAIYPVTDDQGRLIVTDEGVGQNISAYGSGTVTTSGVEQLAVLLQLLPSKIYNDIEVKISSFKDCKWRVVYRDDAGGAATDTEIMQWRTGAGQYSLSDIMKNYELDTSAGTGLQQLLIFVEQRAGTGSDFSAQLSALQVDA